ncbi:MAG: cobalamin biosynthesis protein CbiG [Clostridiales bacterium]|nr:cobalamin biosynthesis protein CbiG [Clostridiales bacterium]
MRLRAAALSDRGVQWGGQLGIPIERPADLSGWTAEVFGQNDAILYIGTADAAVRAIAPHVAGRDRGPAVVVMDELGRSVIPILTGGAAAAEVARMVAQKAGARLVSAAIESSAPALAAWAGENGCAVENPAAISAVSAALRAGKSVGVMITERAIMPPFPVTLTLRPRTLALGIGCRRRADPARLEEGALAFLAQCGVSMLSVRAVATIDLQAGEPAIGLFSQKYDLPVEAYTARQLAAAEGQFANSSYVQKAIGVGTICERAAVLASGGRLLMGRTAIDGAAFALGGDRNT